MIWNPIIKANCAPEPGQLGESCCVMYSEESSSVCAVFTQLRQLMLIHSGEKKMDNDISHLIQASFVIQMQGTESHFGSSVNILECWTGQDQIQTFLTVYFHMRLYQ